MDNVLIIPSLFSGHAFSSYCIFGSSFSDSANSAPYRYKIMQQPPSGVNFSLPRWLRKEYYCYIYNLRFVF